MDPYSPVDVAESDVIDAAIRAVGNLDEYGDGPFIEWVQLRAAVKHLLSLENNENPKETQPGQG